MSRVRIPTKTFFFFFKKFFFVFFFLFFSLFFFPVFLFPFFPSAFFCKKELAVQVPYPRIKNSSSSRKTILEGKSDFLRQKSPKTNFHVRVFGLSGDYELIRPDIPTST